MGTRVGRRPVGALAVVVGALTACTGSPSPGANSTWPAVTTAASTTTSVTPSSTTTTLDAQAALQAEAVEAVKKYYEAWNRAVVSRDSKELRSLTLPQCDPCQRDIAAIDDMKKQNQTARGGLVTVARVTANPGDDAGILVQGQLVRAPVDLLSAAGKVVKSYPEDLVPNVGWILIRSGGLMKIKDIA